MRPGVAVRVGRTRAREAVREGEKIAPRRIAHRLGCAIAIDEVRAPGEGVAGTPSTTPCASRPAASPGYRRAHARAPRFCIGVQTSRRRVVGLVRYPIFAADLHHLLLAGLPVYLNPKPFSELEVNLKAVAVTTVVSDSKMFFNESRS